MIGDRQKSLLFGETTNTNCLSPRGPYRSRTCDNQRVVLVLYQLS